MTSGAYYLGARAFSTQTGNYIVSAVVDDYASNTFTTGTVGIGGTTTGNIETSGDTDWFRVTLTAGVTYQFHLDAAGISGLADPYLELRDSSGTFITSDDDSDGNLNTLITFTASASGTYYLDAHDFSTETGDYVVRADVQGGETFTSTASGIALTGTPQNPATIAAGALITNTTGSFQGDAVYGNTVAAWQITNYGTVSATDTASSGMDLRAGGSVANAAGPQITGDSNGIYIAGSTGTVTNSGTISATGPIIGKGNGVRLTVGGIVTNGASGAVSALIEAVGRGVNIAALGSVINFGTIKGTGRNYGVGIRGETVGIGTPNVSYVANYGTVMGEVEGVFLSSGTIANHAGSGGLAVIEGGLFGIVIGYGAGRVSNGASGATGALIEGGGAGVDLGPVGSVINFGTIIATANKGSGVSANGSVTNYGTIAATDYLGHGILMLLALPSRTLVH